MSWETNDIAWSLFLFVVICFLAYLIVVGVQIYYSIKYARRRLYNLPNLERIEWLTLFATGQSIFNNWIGNTADATSTHNKFNNNYNNTNSNVNGSNCNVNYPEMVRRNLNNIDKATSKLRNQIQQQSNAIRKKAEIATRKIEQTTFTHNWQQTNNVFNTRINEHRKGTYSIVCIDLIWAIAMCFQHKNK